MERSSDQTQLDIAHFLKEYRQFLDTWQQQQTAFDNRLVQVVEHLQALHAHMGAQYLHLSAEIAREDAVTSQQLVNDIKVRKLLTRRLGTDSAPA